MKKLLLLLAVLLAAVPCSARNPHQTGASFEDTFSTGSLDPRWIVSTWNAPGPGTFSAAHVDLSQGMLRLELDQTPASIGAEIATSGTYGYGTYEWTMRTSSTSSTPFGVGFAQSGSVSAGFNWTNGSKTEIDFEVEGQFPNQVEMTSWVGTSNSFETIFLLYGTDQTFHRYKYVWAPGRIDFYVDDLLVSTHTQSVPSFPAHVYINHWGTDDPNFGGYATIGTRYLYVSDFKFTSR